LKKGLGKLLPKEAFIWRVCFFTESRGATSEARVGPVLRRGSLAEGRAFLGRKGFFFEKAFFLYGGREGSST